MTWGMFVIDDEVSGKCFNCERVAVLYVASNACCSACTGTALVAQLIGYSISGFSELSYVHDEDYGKASAVAGVVEEHMKAERG